MGVVFSNVIDDNEVNHQGCIVLLVLAGGHLPANSTSAWKPDADAAWCGVGQSSSNGTWVNDERLGPGSRLLKVLLICRFCVTSAYCVACDVTRSHKIQVGDVLRCGTTVFNVEDANGGRVPQVTFTISCQLIHRRLCFTCFTRYVQLLLSRSFVD